MEVIVSIIIPVYNAENYITETLNSLIKQDYKNLDIILVDDGSSDNSYELCASYLYDKRITLVRQDNKGAPAARNKGLELSKGKYVLFFDADDILTSDAISSMAKIAEEDNSDLVVGNFSTFMSGGLLKKNTQKLHRLSKSIFNLYFISPFPNNKLYKTNLIKSNNIKFDNVKIAQDANFLYKVVPHLNKLSIVNKSICYYRLSLNSISRAYDSRILDVRYSLEVVEEYYKTLNVHKKYFYYLSISKLNHFNTQIKKLSNFTNYDEALYCFEILSKEYWIVFRSIKPKIDIWILKSLIFHLYLELSIRKKLKGCVK